MAPKIIDRPKIFLDNVHLKGFKSIEDLAVDFQKGLNILIGKNGSGKSNFLQFLSLTLGAIRNNKLRFNYAKLEFVSDDSHSFIIELEKDSSPKTSNEDFINRSVISEKFLIDGKVIYDNSIDEGVRKRFEFKNKKIIYRNNLRALFTNLGYRHIYPIYIKFNLPEKLECIDVPGTLTASINNDFINWIYPETLNFIGEIFWSLESFYDSEPDRLMEISTTNITEHLKIQEYIVDNIKFYTSIEDVRYSKNLNIYIEEKSVIIENIKLEFKVNNHWLPWSQLSDGTKRLFYIISEVTFSNGLILIEEPELGIHPHQFNLLMDFLKYQSEEKQIILSTHSPKALDHFSPEELNNILLTNYDLAKGTQIRHLDNHQVKKAKKYMKEVGFFSDYWMLSDLE